jgi:hypothetical protein
VGGIILGPLALGSAGSRPRKLKNLRLERDGGGGSVQGRVQEHCFTDYLVKSDVRSMTMCVDRGVPPRVGLAATYGWINSRLNGWHALGVSSPMSSTEGPTPWESSTRERTEGPNTPWESHEVTRSV